MLLLVLVEQDRPGDGRGVAPEAAPAPKPRRAALPLLTAVVVTVGLVAAGLFVDRFDAAHPRQTRLAYALDTATGEAVWGSRSAAPSADSERFFATKDWATRPAQAADLRAPELSVIKDETAGGGRTLTLRLKPTGEAPVAGLTVMSPEGAAPVSYSTIGPITVNDRRISTGTGFAYHAPPEELEVTLVLPAGPARIQAFEQGHDLSILPGYQPMPETIVMYPQTTVFRVHTL
jgi:hypothetical protein